MTPEAIPSGSTAEWAYFVLTILVLLTGQLVIFITNRVALKKDMEALRRDILRIEDDVAKKTTCITSLKEKQQSFMSCDRCVESRIVVTDAVNVQVVNLSDDILELKEMIKINVATSTRYREEDVAWKLELASTLSRLSGAAYGGAEDRRA